MQKEALACIKLDMQDRLALRKRLSLCIHLLNPDDHPADSLVIIVTDW